MSKGQGIVRFVHLGGQVPDMNRTPNPLCAAQGKVEGILTNYPDGGHADTDSP